MSVSEQKPPPIRTDLEIVPQYYRGELCYVAKDPVTLTYYRLGEVEYVVVKCFQQGMGIEQTQREVKRRTGAEISEIEIFKFANQLRSSGLLKSKGMEDVRRLARHKELARKHKIKQALSNYLFVTIPLWDPDKILAKLLPYFRLLLNNYFLAVWMILTGAALWIIGTNFAGLVSNAFSLLSGWNLLILSIVIFCVKFIHEMGHALTCKHFGGEVHAVGPAFLVFQPCMFTDTTDAWLFTSKWERIAVTAAGIMAEIMLASLAAVVWISSQPGLVKQVAYITMMACSVNTIFFNANPLIRFDGYYILSDLVEIPNLRAKTSQYMSHVVDRYVIGLKAEPPRMQEGDPLIFLSYGVLRQMYLVVLTFSIGLFLYSLFEPLGIFAWLTSLYSLVLGPFWRKGKELARQYQSGSVRLRYLVVLGGALALAVVLWFVPMDYTVQAPCVVTPGRISVMRAPVSGQVERILVRPGAWVEQGAELARMRNEELVLRGAQVGELLQETEARLRGSLDTDPARYEMLLREKLKLTHESQELARKIEELTLCAPQDGVVVGVHRMEMKLFWGRHDFVSPDEDAEMETERLEGRTVRAGTGLMAVATASPIVLEMFVREHDLSDVSLGDPVEYVLRFDPRRVFSSDVASIMPVDVKTIENVGITLADVGYIPVKPAPDGTNEPLVTLYMLRSNLVENKQGLAIGMTGKARITYGRGPVGSYYIGRLVRGIRLRLQQV